MRIACSFGILRVMNPLNLWVSALRSKGGLLSLTGDETTSGAATSSTECIIPSPSYGVSSLSGVGDCREAGKDSSVFLLSSQL